MEKANAKLVWLMLFSLITAGVGQAMIFSAAPTAQATHNINPEHIALQMAHVVSSLLKTGIFVSP